MKRKNITLFSLSLIVSLFMFAAFSTDIPAQPSVTTQSSQLYQDMSLNQRQAFVAEKAREISRRMSGTDYAFTRGFEAEIQKAVDAYAQRIGNGTGSDVRLVLERGQTVAPRLIRIFKTNNVSPLIGLYLPMIESAYVNISTPNSMGSVGMFQFVPQTGQHYGLSAGDLLDVDKSADAAARLITDGISQFSSDPMKEALSLLAYNRGGRAVEQDLATWVNDQNRACSICALTEQRDKMDKGFRNESVYYVPRFLAAAIIGENPQAFGLPTRPLSSVEPKP